MKYVLLGKLGVDWIKKHEERVQRVMSKFAELGITLETVYYTQGSVDFIDIVEVQDPENLLSFAVWYTGEGMGTVESCPAFDAAVFASAAALA